MANNAMTVRDQRIQNFKNVLNDSSIRNRVRTSLGENAGGFIASMMDLYEGESALQNCDPQKVAMECLKAASLKLPIVKSLGFAYVIPYGSTPTFIIGYKGMIQLAQRTGQYRYLNADAVYEGEEVRTDRLTGRVTIGGARTGDNVIGYFAYFQLVNGYEQCLYMTVDEIKRYARKYSKAYSSGPWKTEFDAMARKTVLRRILKFGPMSTEMQTAEKYEVQSAEQSAQSEVRRNANRGDVIDVSFSEERTAVDPVTGEVLSGDGGRQAPDPRPEMTPEPPEDVPEEPGF